MGNLPKELRPVAFKKLKEAKKVKGKLNQTEWEKIVSETRFTNVYRFLKMIKNKTKWANTTLTK